MHIVESHLHKLTEYKNIYFDLDNTLWDVEANARDAFREIFDLHHLWNSITDFEKFIETFSVYNEQLWEKYRLGQIKKDALRSKPDRRIFEYALKSVNAKKSESLMMIL